MVYTTQSIIEEIQVLPETILDAAGSATTVGFVYIFDNQPGYSRHRWGNKLYYIVLMALLNFRIWINWLVLKVWFFPLPGKKYGVANLIMAINRQRDTINSIRNNIITLRYGLAYVISQNFTA